MLTVMIVVRKSFEKALWKNIKLIEILNWQYMRKTAKCFFAQLIFCFVCLNVLSIFHKRISLYVYKMFLYLLAVSILLFGNC